MTWVDAGTFTLEAVYWGMWVFAGVAVLCVGVAVVAYYFDLW